MLAAGRSNRAIACQLVVTLDTVKKHVSHIMAKLGAASRTEAVARARQLGLIPQRRPCQSPVTRHYPRCGPGTAGADRRLYRVSTSG
jgi:hypothetical protein